MDEFFKKNFFNQTVDVFGSCGFFIDFVIVLL